MRSRLILGWSSDGRQLLVNETIGLAGRILALPVDGAPAVVLGDRRHR